MNEILRLELSRREDEIKNVRKQLDTALTVIENQQQQIESMRQTITLKGVWKSLLQLGDHSSNININKDNDSPMLYDHCALAMTYLSVDAIKNIKNHNHHEQQQQLNQSSLRQQCFDLSQNSYHRNSLSNKENINADIAHLDNKNNHQHQLNNNSTDDLPHLLSHLINKVIDLNQQVRLCSKSAHENKRLREKIHILHAKSTLYDTAVNSGHTAIHTLLPSSSLLSSSQPSANQHQSSSHEPFSTTPPPQITTTSTTARNRTKRSSSMLKREGTSERISNNKNDSNR